MATLDVAVARLRHLWPGARIGVLTSEVENLLRHCPDVTPLPARGRYALFGSLARRRLSGRRLPAPLARARGEWALRTTSDADVATLAAELRSADLFVVSGRGGLTDAFAEDALQVLDLLELAMDLAVPAVLFGQGVGPVVDAGLRRRMAEVLPRAALVALREGELAPGLLTDLGVPPARLRITGDDALACVVGVPSREASVLGVNLRRSDRATRRTTASSTPA